MEKHNIPRRSGPEAGFYGYWGQNKKFLKMVKHGDTAALELLFTPDDMILEKDPLWDRIIEKRDQLLSKKINAMIGYARQQANKYGIKGYEYWY